MEETTISDKALQAFTDTMLGVATWELAPEKEKQELRVQLAPCIKAAVDAMAKPTDTGDS